MKHFLVLLLLSTLCLFNAAQAHEMSMAEMQIREMTPGQFLWHWSAGEKGGVEEYLTPIWPEHCQAMENSLLCGETGLKGALSIQGVGERYSAAIVKIAWLDGQSRVYTLTASYPTAQLFGSAEDRRGFIEIVSSYTELGIEHIFSGIDHQLFVIGLMFLVGFNKRLIWTITAFTAAHSVTLAVSALGWLALRSPPVEATIALSIVLVASEALQREQTLARRFPALLAFLFGLVHGLGFAGALREIGLPDQHVLTALLAFNAGVELGQLLLVGAASVVWLAAKRWPKLVLARTATLYGIGSIAAYWSWERAAAIFS